MTDISLIHPILLVKKLSANATLPAKASVYASGYELSSAVNISIPKKGKAIVPTDLSLTIPYGTYGKIASCSGSVYKGDIHVKASALDYNDRNNVGVTLVNSGNADFPVKKGDKIAQLILERVVPDAVVKETN